MSEAARSNQLRLVAALVTVVLTAGVVAVMGRDDGPSHPDSWDERVLDLVAFVEEERGHRFDHPVAIDFLTEEEYTERTRRDGAEVTDEERDDLEVAEGLMRAMGLVEGDVDLFESGNDLADTGTLAFYNGETERVTVRGSELTLALSRTLVHELTHVLQDQTFGLDPLTDDEATSGELAAFRALVEGDAVRIERRWAAALDADDLAALETDETAEREAFADEAIPEALSALFAVPYALGEGFVAMLDARRGSAVDDAFELPPTTEEHLLDVWAYLDFQEPLVVESPELPRGVDDDDVLDEGDFGAASLFLVLAARIDAVEALDAATGWGGDAYVNYQRDGQACVLLAVTGDDDDETAELALALTAWAAAGPAGSASVDDGEVVTLQACDPGAQAAGTPQSVHDALLLASVRTDIAAGTLDAGGPEAFARCYADGVIRAFTVVELASDQQPADFEGRLAAVAADCQ